MHGSGESRNSTRPGVSGCAAAGVEGTISSSNYMQEEGTDMASKQDNQGWPFSDEAAARDAGIIPPDPTSDQGLGVNPGVAPPEEFVSAITTTIDRDAGDEEAIDTEGADETKIRSTEPVTRPDVDHPIRSGDYPSQPDAARASDDPDEMGYQNDADPPR